MISLKFKHIILINDTPNTLRLNKIFNTFENKHLAT